MGVGMGGSGLRGRLGMRSSRGSGGLGGAGVVVLGTGTLAAWGLRGSMGLSMLHSFHCTTLQHTFLYTRPRLCPHMQAGTCMQVCTDIPTHTQSHLKTQIITLVKEMALKLQSKASTLVVVLETKHPEKREFSLSLTVSTEIM